MIKGILTEKEPPIILALLLAALAWAVTHISDRLGSAPIISYRFDGTPSDPRLNVDDKKGIFEVRNLTLSTVFTNLVFAVDVQEGKLKDGMLLQSESSLLAPGETANPESVPTYDVKTSKEKVALLFTIPELQPRQSWKMAFWGATWSKPILAFRASYKPAALHPLTPGPVPAKSPTLSPESMLSSLAGQKPPAVLLLEDSLTSQLVENEVQILYLLTFLFALLCIAIVIAWVRHGVPTVPPSHERNNSTSRQCD